MWLVVVEALSRALEEAPAHDVNWWGAEAKTQIKGMRQDMKAIQTSIKSAPTVEEAQANQKALKWWGCLCDVVEIVMKHGLESSEFREVFDRCTAQLALAPTVSMRWPAHVFGARATHDIGEVEDVERWTMRVNSETLKEHGGLHEQEQLVAARLARYWRINGMEESTQALQSFLAAPGVLGSFEEPVNEFLEAFYVFTLYRNLEFG